MTEKNSTVEIKGIKVVFSREIINYFESIKTEENSEWIDKYFEVLSDPSNFNAKKYNIHHIRPCFTFKDETRKTRTETEPLANKFIGNLIKLSIYNHLFAHFYLWKIFDNKSSKISFQRMCNIKQFKNLNENELKEIAKLKEGCSKENQTKEDKANWQKNYHPFYYKNNRNRIIKRVNEYTKNNKGEINKYKHDWYMKNRDEILKNQKEFRENNKEIMKERNKKYYENNKDKILQKRKDKREKINKKESEYNHRLCFDPINEDYPNYGALKGRIRKHKELYKNIKASECIIKDKTI